MRRVFTLAAIVCLFHSCTDNSATKAKEDSIRAADSVHVANRFSPYWAPVELIILDCSKDNLIVAEKGTSLRIPEGSFTDSAGIVVSGEIYLFITEAFTPTDFAQCNVFTLFEGKPLETGGMICINASSMNNEHLVMTPGKSIVVKMPAINEVKDGMQLFEGRETVDGVVWEQPVDLPTQDSARKMLLDALEKTTNITYTVEGYPHQMDVPGYGYPQEVNTEVSRIAWEGTGLKIPRDTTFVYNGYTVHFFKNETLTTWTQYMYGQDGMNTYAEDLKTNYIFSLKKLGWANIDRLAADPRTKAVDLNISVENENEFGYIYVTLITENMYLPGYKRKDKSFSFSHNDDELQQLPLGASATILATTYKNGVPYYSIFKLFIKDPQRVTLRLEQTTDQDLNNTLEYEL